MRGIVLIYSSLLIIACNGIDHDLEKRKKMTDQELIHYCMDKPNASEFKKCMTL